MEAYLAENIKKNHQLESINLLMRQPAVSHPARGQTSPRNHLFKAKPRQRTRFEQPAVSFGGVGNQAVARKGGHS